MILLFPHTFDHASVWSASKMTIKMAGQFKQKFLVAKFHKNKTTRKVTNFYIIPDEGEDKL